MRLFAALLAIAVLAGCASTQSPAIPENLPPAPADFEASCGSGGGNPNVWEGYTLFADGRVRYWSGLRIELESEERGMVPAEEVAAFWYAVQQAEYFGISKNGLGDKTAVLEIEGGDQKNRTSWPVVGNTGRPDVVQQLFAQCQEVAQKANP